MKYYISDLHLFHTNVTKEGRNFDGRPFETMEEMLKTIHDNWNARVTNGDTVYILQAKTACGDRGSGGDISGRGVIHMKRSRAWRRAKNYSKALRKYRLAQELYGPGGWHMPFHGYSKNKIHCSCPMCAEKTNARISHSLGPVSVITYEWNGKDFWRIVGTRIPGTCKRLGKNWTASDRRKIEDQRDQLTEWRKAG